MRMVLSNLPYATTAERNSFVVLDVGHRHDFRNQLVSHTFERSRSANFPNTVFDNNYDEDVTAHYFKRLVIYCVAYVNRYHQETARDSHAVLGFRNETDSVVWCDYASAFVNWCRFNRYANVFVNVVHVCPRTSRHGNVLRNRHRLSNFVHVVLFVTNFRHDALVNVRVIRLSKNYRSLDTAKKIALQVIDKIGISLNIDISTLPQGCESASHKAFHMFTAQVNDLRHDATALGFAVAAQLVHQVVHVSHDLFHQGVSFVNHTVAPFQETMDMRPVIVHYLVHHFTINVRHSTSWYVPCDQYVQTNVCHTTYRRRL